MGDFYDNEVRLRWCSRYSLLSNIWSIFFINDKKAPLIDNKDYIAAAFLCFSCAALGVALGLYNSRTDQGSNSFRDKHYILYFGFVWVLASLSAFVIFGDNIDKGFLHACVSAVLVGIVVGFTGDKLAGKIFDLK